eukprot:GHVR01031951.1.p1 GENE.GHVR01031951.1~~GHVR01031951.1.p1  ORF type:complete len:216 (-),score=47.10 GHVR01031951.1:136-783(-)
MRGKKRNRTSIVRYNDDNLRSQLLATTCISDTLPEPQLPQVSNLVVSVHVGTEIDLKELALSCRNAEYNPRKVNATVVRLFNVKGSGTSLVFRTGRVVLTGGKSLQCAKHAAKVVVRLIQKTVAPEARFIDFKVDSLIARADCRFPIRLEGFAAAHRGASTYEPEVFPGLIFRWQEQAVVVLFVTGRIMILGCKSHEGVLDVFNNVYPSLSPHKQ